MCVTSSFSTADFVGSSLYFKALGQDLKWNSKKIKISHEDDSGVATIKILWKNIPCTIAISYNKPDLKIEDAKRILPDQMDNIILLMSRYAYGDVSSLVFQPTNNKLWRRYTNPSEHKGQNRGSIVDFLHPSSPQDKINVLNGQKVKVHEKIHSGKIKEPKLSKTTARFHRIEETIRLLEGGQRDLSLGGEGEVMRRKGKVKKHPKASKEREEEGRLDDSRQRKKAILARDEEIDYDLTITKDKTPKLRRRKGQKSAGKESDNNKSDSKRIETLEQKMRILEERIERVPRPEQREIF